MVTTGREGAELLRARFVVARLSDWSGALDLRGVPQLEVCPLGGDRTEHIVFISSGAGRWADGFPHLSATIVGVVSPERGVLREGLCGWGIDGGWPEVLGRQLPGAVAESRLCGPIKRSVRRYLLLGRLHARCRQPPRVPWEVLAVGRGPCKLVWGWFVDLLCVLVAGRDALRREALTVARGPVKGIG